MDAVDKRRIAFYSFVSFQAAKAAIYMQDRENALIYWVVIDLIYIVSLRFAQIPWLKLSIIGSFIVGAALCSVDAGIIAILNPKLPYQPTIGATSNDQIIQNSINMDGHILGSHTVLIKPPILAKLSPNTSVFCTLTNMPQTIPILIKGTPPFLVDYSITTAQGVLVKSNVSVSLHSDSSQEVTDKRRTGIYAIEATEYGVYKLTGIREQNGDSGRIITNPPVSFVACPVASLQTEGSKDICMTEIGAMKIMVSGSTPITVYYLVKSGDSELISVVSTDRVQSIPIFFEPETSGKHSFTIARVVDAFNNTIDYPAKFSGSLPDYDCSRASKLKVENLESLEITVHSVPSAKFQGCDNGLSVRGLKKETLPINMLFEGEAEFKIGIRSEVYGQKTTDSAFKFDTSTGRIVTNQPGIFKIVSVSDKWCKGVPLLPDICQVSEVDPPTLQISSSIIEEACLGAVGANFEASFTGAPPFWIEYTVNGVRQRKSGIKKTRTEFKFEPDLPGSYEYIFDRIGDDRYSDGIDVFVPSVNQVVHPHSSAQFRDSSKLQRIVCIGDAVEYEVEVSGSGPWKLEYEKVFSGKSERFNITIGPHDKIARFSIEMLKTSGIYLIGLVQITDVNGCVRLLETPDASIQVLASRPSASFQKEQPEYVLEGTRTRVGLYLTGRAPFLVEYRDVSKNIPFRSTLYTGGTIDLSSGSYELTSVQDSVCIGSIGKGALYTVFEIPKPLLGEVNLPNSTVGSDGKVTAPPVCSGKSVGFDVGLKGKSPWNVRYLLQFSNLGSKTVQESQEIAVDVETSFLRILIDTSRAGAHVYKIYGISDAHYKNVQSTPQYVEQIVYAVPSAIFIEPEQRVFHCITKESADWDLSVRLEGHAPFTIIISQSHDNVHTATVTRTATDRELKRDGLGYIYNFKTPATDSMGLFKFVIQSVSDSTGCSSSYDKDSNKDIETSIQVADQAKIKSLNPPVVCIGDILSYNLQGTPPFTVGYSFLGVDQPDVIVSDPVISFWAGEAGDLVVNKVCNGMGCCDHHISIDSTMSSTIKPLPKAFVDGGENIVDDIREGIPPIFNLGDQSEFVVEFEGTPPFSFSYSRTNQNEIAYETNTVSEIMESKWSISTTQEGIFRVNSINDKYCGYPRRMQNIQMANIALKNP